jgi:anti-sigma regulatory factor (Ser/Thr protein kinase)/CheY-like chemotaxis protein
METRVIGVLSSNSQLSTNLKHACEAFHEDFEVDLFEDDETFAQYLNYELPDLVVLDVSDPVLRIRQLLMELKNDPWLHFGGVILVYDQERVGVVPSAIRDVNLISILEYGRIDFYMPRLLRILSHNRNILYQRDLHALLSQNLSGSFVLDNDPFDLTTYSNLLANFLFNANLVSHEQKERFYVAIMELLVNAIEHGNCRITYEEKSAYLAKGGDAMDLIRERNQDPEINKKKVHLFYRIRPNISTFRVRDEGEGFDWRKYNTATGTEGLDESHGRGIFMASHYLTNLTYNDKGNEVYFELEHPRSETNAVPEMFADRREVVFKDGSFEF